MQRSRVVLRILVCSIAAVLGLTAWRVWPVWKTIGMRKAVLQGTIPNWWPTTWRRECDCRLKLAETLTSKNRVFRDEAELAMLTEEMHLEIEWNSQARDLLKSQQLEESSSFYGPVCLKTGLRQYCDKYKLGMLLNNGTITITTRNTAERGRTAYNSLALTGCGIEMLKSADVRARREAAFALGEYVPNPKIALPALIDALSDDDPDVRVNAIYAIGRIQPDAAVAVPAMAQLLRREPEPYVYWVTARVFGDLGQVALPGLIVGIKHGDIAIRRHAVRCLEKLGEPAVQFTVEQLVSDLQSDDVYVRTRAATGMSSLERYGTFAVPIANEGLKSFRSAITEKN